MGYVSCRSDVRELDPVAIRALVLRIANRRVEFIVNIALLGEDLPAYDVAALATVQEVPQVVLAPSAGSSTGVLCVQLRIHLAADVDLARPPPFDGGAVRLASVGLEAEIVVGELADRGFAVGDERAPAGRLAFEMTVVVDDAGF